jgi:hypothetical protein
VGDEIVHADAEAELPAKLMADDLDERQSLAQATKDVGRVNGTAFKSACRHHGEVSMRESCQRVAGDVTRIAEASDPGAFVCLARLVGMHPVSAPSDRDDPRLLSAWRTWLSALAVDAEAAVAAALAYEALAGEGRDAWLDALDEDRASLGVPAVALYAPLLAVEPDEGRRARIGTAMATAGAVTPPRGDVRALLGRAPGGDHVCVLVSPLYLDFVALLVCRYRPDRGFVSVRRDPVRHIVDAIGRRIDGTSFVAGSPLACTVDGVSVVESPLTVVVEELAHTIVADRREGRAAPEALGSYVHLFAPDIGGAAGPPSPRPSPVPSLP